MAINWFRGGKKQQQKQQQDPQEYTIDDLIVLERYEEAAERLRARLKENPNDLHGHLRLADVYTQLQQVGKAVEEYVYVAEEYGLDGFHDKGIALLSRAMKLAPLDPSLRAKTDRLQREKSMEHVRGMALEGLRQAGGLQAGTSALELKKLWHNLVASTVVQHLSGEQLKKLFSAMTLLRFDAQAEIAHEGSPDGFLLLIVNGLVEASIEAGGRAVTMRSFTSGDVIGEAALFERGVWPASFLAAEPVTALKLTREGLEQCLIGNSDPRGFLETLREQHNDRDVAAMVRRLRTGT